MLPVSTQKNNKILGWMWASLSTTTVCIYLYQPASEFVCVNSIVLYSKFTPYYQRELMHWISHTIHVHFCFTTCNKLIRQQEIFIHFPFRAPPACFQYIFQLLTLLSSFTTHFTHIFAQITHTLSHYFSFHFKFYCIYSKSVHSNV